MSRMIPTLATTLLLRLRSQHLVSSSDPALIKRTASNQSGELECQQPYQHRWFAETLALSFAGESVLCGGVMSRAYLS